MNAPARIVADLDAETMALVTRLAAEHGVSVAAYCAEAVRVEAIGQTAYAAFIKEGLDSADSGETFTQTEMEAWVAARYGHRAAAE